MARTPMVVAGTTAAISVVLVLCGWYIANDMGLANDPIMGWSRALGIATSSAALVALHRWIATALVDEPNPASWPGPRLFLVIVALPLIGYAVQSIRRIEDARDGLVLARSMLPFAVYELALVAASLAALVTITTPFARNSAPIARRRSRSVCAIVVAVACVTSGMWMFRSLQAWEPAQTSPTSPVAAVPGSLGSEEYRVPIFVSNWGDVVAAGNGFVVFSPLGSIVGYDGPTGAARWEVDGVSGRDRMTVAWRDRADRSGMVVFAKDRSLVALDAGTGQVLWARLMPSRVDEVQGGNATVVVTTRTTRHEPPSYLSLDATTGRITARSTSTPDLSSTPSGLQWTRNDNTIRDASGQVVDTLPRGLVDGARYVEAIPSPGGRLVLFTIDFRERARQIYLRNTESHAEVPLPVPSSGYWNSGTWLGTRLMLRSSGGSVVFDPMSGNAAPATIPTCRDWQQAGRLIPVAGAVVAFCGSGSDAELIGLT